MPLRRSVRAAAVATSLGLVISACTGSSPTPAPSSTGTATSASSPTGTAATSAGPAVAKAKFTDCTSQITPSLPGGNGPRVTRLSFGCARVPVPADYAEPDGRMLTLYVVKVHDNSQSRRIGSLLVNPGGPGASGVQLAVNLGLEVSDNLLDHFDLVGFDPRGVFLSDAVQCIPDAEKDRIAAASPDVRTAAGLAQVTALTASVSRACGTRYGSELGRFNTADTARDLDVLRRALAEDQLTYLGYSYGTELGAAYAHLFPATVRALVLDGAVDPAQTPAVAAQRQAAGFEAAFDRFAADCATQTACRPLGPARAAVTGLTARADRTALRTSRPGDRRRATGAIVLGAVAAALYDRSRWPVLATALLAARRGDARALFAINDAFTGRAEDGHYSNLLDAYTTITCNDEVRRPSAAEVQALATRWARSYPLFGLNAAAELLSCRSWPAPPTPVPPATAPGAGPILVIGTVHDPATPLSAARALARSLSSGVLLSWDGDGHTAFPKTPCVTAAVEKYLIDPQTPLATATCPAR
ncbi:MAG: alpha/beta fold hydrolase [bacterium]